MRIKPSRTFTLPLFSLSAIMLAGCGELSPGRHQDAPEIENSTALTPRPAAAVPERVRYTREELHRKARTDPEGADAVAIDQMSRQELIATSINSAGFLCAQVIDFYMRGDDIVAHCVEYRNGSGRVSYRIDPAKSLVEQLD